MDRQVLAVATGITNEQMALAAADGIMDACGGNIQRLPHISCEELSQVSGIGEARAKTLRASFELSKRICMDGKIHQYVTAPDQAADVFKKHIAAGQQEVFAIICLNTKGRMLSFREVFRGSGDSCPVSPKDVYREAIAANARRIILGHNHPSSVISPSNEDVALTKKLVELGKMLEIRVDDHIIVGNMSSTYFSMAEHKICEF